MKIPQKWMENPNWERLTVHGARDFFATALNVSYQSFCTTSLCNLQMNI